jgi:hypothetical protein
LQSSPKAHLLSGMKNKKFARKSLPKNLLQDNNLLALSFFPLENSPLQD